MALFSPCFIHSIQSLKFQKCCMLRMTMMRWCLCYMPIRFGDFFQKLFIRILMKFKIHWLWNFVATLKPNSWSYHKLLFFLQRFYRKTSLDKQKLISPFELSVSMWSVQQWRGGKGAKHDILQSVIWDFLSSAILANNTKVLSLKG